MMKTPREPLECTRREGRGLVFMLCGGTSESEFLEYTAPKRGDSFREHC